MHLFVLFIPCGNLNLHIVADDTVQNWLNEQPTSPSSVPSITQGFNPVKLVVVVPQEKLLSSSIYSKIVLRVPPQTVLLCSLLNIMNPNALLLLIFNGCEPS